MTHPLRGTRRVAEGAGTNPAFVKPLTSLRFLAALWVVLFHHGREFLIPTAAPARDLQKVGYAGVSLFFLLSGFVLAYNYLDRADAGELRRGAFWRARLARVYPLYLLCLVATGPSLLVSDPGGTALRLGLLQAWHPSLVGAWNLPGWSLSAEAFFYLLFPFALPLAARLPRRALLPSFLALVLLALLPPATFLLLREPGLKTAVNSTTPMTAFLKYNPLVRLPDFLAGVVLGAAYLRLSLGTRLAARPWLRRGILSAGLVSVWALVEARPHVPWELLHNGLFLVPFGLLLVALSPGEGTLARLTGYRLPVFLGEASYAVYLFHTPFHDWLKAALSGTGVSLDAKTFFPIYLLTLLALASLLHLLVERPARRWIRSGVRPPRWLARAGGPGARRRG